MTSVIPYPWGYLYVWLQVGPWPPIAVFQGFHSAMIGAIPQANKSQRNEPGDDQCVVRFASSYAPTGKIYC